MQRPIATLRIAGLAGLAGLVAALGGCAASGGDESILVLKAVAPPTTATGGVCTFTPSETEAGLVQGALDVTSGFGYQFIAQLTSRITASAGQQDARTILLRGANVDLTFSSAEALGPQIADLQSQGLLHFMKPISAPLPPNGSLVDAPFELIPAGVADEFDRMGFGPDARSATVQATFTIVGDLAGGNVSSQAFRFSVTLVKGGLIIDNGPCSTVPRSFQPRTGNICFPGQDFVIDCCEGATARVCPAVGTAM